jgi:hypothetical protein
MTYSDGDRPTQGGIPPANQSDEIEITPEMIRAGLLALWTHDEMHFSDEDRMRAVWKAMVAARPPK